MWARFDDRFHENRKIKRAWRRTPASIGLHVMAITYSAGHLTDGFVDVDFVEERMPAKRARERAVGTLVEAGLWSTADEGWQIHDFCVYNETRADIEARRAAKSLAGKKGAATRWSDSTPIAGAIAPASSSQDGRIAKNGTEPVTEPVTVTEPEKGANAPVDPARIDAARERLAAVRRIFDAWVESTGRTGRTVFSPDRRKLIDKWLDHPYTEEELIDAVRGWKHSPPHNGSKDGTVYNDLETLLRKPKTIETLRDLEQGNRRQTDGSFLSHLKSRGHAAGDAA